MKPNVKIKTAQEMGLSNEVAVFEDGLRTGAQSGNYEWWYTDCKFPDGSSLVIIFFSKPVTSMANHFQPYVSFDFLSPLTNKFIPNLSATITRFVKNAATYASGIAT